MIRRKKLVLESGFRERSAGKKRVVQAGENAFLVEKGSLA